MNNKDDDKNKPEKKVQVFNNKDGTYTKKFFEGDKLVHEETDTHENYLDRLRTIRNADTDESSNNKLKEFLQGLKSSPETDYHPYEEDYEDDGFVDPRDSPIYRLGREEGFNEAEELFSNKLRNIRKTIKNLLTHC